MSSVHSIASSGFAGGDHYDRFRPSYPNELIDFTLRLAKIPRSFPSSSSSSSSSFTSSSSQANSQRIRIVDLGAGTGLFTRAWLQRFHQLTAQSEPPKQNSSSNPGRIAGSPTDPLPFPYELIAVEPVDGMRATFHSSLPKIPIVNASASQLPFPDSSIDILYAAQCFHWFSDSKSQHELFRVLKPHGIFFTLWNSPIHQTEDLLRNPNHEWIAGVESIVDDYMKPSGAPQFKYMNWHKNILSSTYFTERAVLKLHESVIQTMNSEEIINRVFSLSAFAAMNKNQKEIVTKRLQNFFAEHPQTKGKNKLEYAYNTYLYVYEKTTPAEAQIKNKVLKAKL